MKNTDRELEKFRLAYKEADGIYAAFARESGLAVMEYWVIWMVSEGVRTQAEISDTLFVSKQTVNSACRHLEKNGLITLAAVMRSLTLKAPKIRHLVVANVAPKVFPSTALLLESGKDLTEVLKIGRHCL